jgi:D-alanyl-D-alanine carboxypeptidase/D-alanyl-D-alanine-endopeptidase (penicillin-binding protein 4)
MKEFRRYLFLFLTGFCCGGALLGARAQETNAARSLEELRAQLTAQIEQPRFDGALWGVKVVSLDTGKELFAAHADRLMSPASNSKLYTGSLALSRLGADYHIVTPVLATAKPDASGTLPGDVVISGRGDPSWNQRHAGTNFWNLFSPFVAALTNAGVRHVTGDLIGDTTFFRSSPAGSGWTVEDLEDAEGAEISALTLNDNFTSLRVSPGRKAGEPCRLELLDPCTGLQLDNQTVTGAGDPEPRVEVRRFRGETVAHVFGRLPAGGAPETNDLPVLRPAEWFASALKEALRRNGIVVDGAARAVAWPSPPPVAGVKLGEVVSPALGELVRDFMKPSQNLETDLIFQHTGELARDPNATPWTTSETCALTALHRFLATNNLPAADVHFDEGSGLSRNNLTTADATVALLRHMAAGPAAAAFTASLPVAGVDGTLRRRMKNTPAYQNVRAKTGTLRWANALSGYVTTAAGERLVFSLMLNRYDSPPDRKRTDELDAIAVMLARFTGRSDAPLAQQFAPLGTLIVTQFVNAPFPHPARAAGHRYHDEFYSAAEHYSDRTVALFIPKHFHAAAEVDFVVHFHGWHNTVAGTLEQFQLVSQFAASGKNAILIVPEGPRDAPDSFGGKLEDTNGFAAFMAEVMEKLRGGGGPLPAETRLGSVIISGHSGGYHVMAAILDHGGLADKIREAWLFDALYGNAENFTAWQQRGHGRLLDIYTDHGGTKVETEKMMAGYRAAGTDFYAAEDAAATADQLRTNAIVFLHSGLAHDEVIAKRGAFGQFLKTSCLPDETVR